MELIQYIFVYIWRISAFIFCAKHQFRLNFLLGLCTRLLAFISLICCFYLCLSPFFLFFFLLYRIRMWQTKHLNPAWDFETELGRKVRSMLNEMDHPINMAHMAKLFTAQLILSCNSMCDFNVRTINMCP